ncbi:MAG: DUF2309 domain-containing protein [Microscillaceae bacterium]|nr:DUF2309 domain-containing protein [Microscillaceae bacterium]
MKKEKGNLDINHIIQELKHYLPAQAPLKDFVHHNTLHTFQHLKFDKAIHTASEIFGYHVSLNLDEYRAFYHKGMIRKEILDKVILQRKGDANATLWKNKLLIQDYHVSEISRVGLLRANWKKHYHIDLDSLVHPILFRVLCSYLDQGIAIWKFPVWDKGFMASIRTLEKNSFSSVFRTERARHLLLHSHLHIDQLLKILVGDETLYEHYLFDQQFSHQGWSGIVSSIEDQPDGLLDHKKITLKELIQLELLLEIDALDFSFGEIWAPLSHKITEKPTPLFAEIEESEFWEILSIWQEVYEWSYYDEVLIGIQQQENHQPDQPNKSFQALFCIDDRECSFRRYLEKFDPQCETFGTPGFFHVEFFYKPEHGRFYTKLCPAPVTPKYLIKETKTKAKRKKEMHFTKHTHSLFGGFIITHTLGFWSAFRLFFNIFRPTMSPATSHCFKHMDKYSSLTIENTNPEHKENNLQIGFTIEEMVTRVEDLLRGIGMIQNFAPIVYAVGHGSSSVNNPHYAAYECGACSGRPGSVNARVISYMANHPKVRKILRERGIDIPDETQFLGGIHDTCRDEIAFYDEELLSPANQEKHQQHIKTFKTALAHNAKERSRRFELIHTNLDAEKVHKQVLKRSISLFEPRPELNHATNSLCIVGRRSLTKNIFLDRRAFLNSYDYALDLNGDRLFGIMKPLGPVCGGINLEYYFSRVNNQKLGAGSKLPHNVMGLFGVANGIEGDLRPGLPSQMIEIHDPIRLLIIVEHFPEVVLDVIQRAPDMYEWFIHEWVQLVAIHPQSRELYRFKDGYFSFYETSGRSIKKLPESELEPLVASHHENLPVYLTI